MTKSVLVVEDDIAILGSLVEVLENEGYEALSARNGRAALELLERLPEMPAAILLDWMMPELDGFGFRKQQLENPRFASIPVILMSAHPGLEQKKNGLGKVDYLKKPIDIDVLSEKLKRVIFG